MNNNVLFYRTIMTKWERRLRNFADATDCTDAELYNKLTKIMEWDAEQEFIF